MISLPFSRFPSYGKEEPFYAYACGRVRALELSLIDRVRMQRLKELKSAAEVFRNLQDTYYSRFLQEIERPEEFATIIPDVRMETYKTVAELLQEDYLKELLWEYDFKNLKIALKLVIAEKEPEGVLVYETVNFPFALLYEAIKEDRFNLLPLELGKAAELAIEAYYEKHEVRKIDTAIDRYFYDTTLSRFKSDFLKNYYRIKADFTNIFTYLRLNMMGKMEYLSEYLLMGGFIPVEFFRKVQVEQEFFKELETLPYFNYLKEGLTDFQRTGDVLLLERGYENYVVDYLRTTKYIDMGHEPIMAYFLARMHEIKVLKIIITGKLVGVKQDELQKRVPEVIG